MKKAVGLFLLLGCSLLYSQDGTLDMSFGNAGRVITNINNQESANGLVIQSDGKIVVAGYTYSNIYGNDVLCIRYNSDGTLDNTFGNNGIVTFDIQQGSDDKALAIDIQSDGKLVLAGYSDNGSDREALVMRLNTDGTPDTSFGQNGSVLTNFTTNGIPVRQDEYRTVKIHQVTGNIVVGGTSYSATNNSRAIVARYTPTGSLDTTFATGGKYTSLPNAQSSSNYLFSIEDLAIKSNGKITVVGWSSAWFYLGRLNTNGTMDTTFSTNGYNHSWGGTMYAVELNNDDSFYFAGEIWTSPEIQLYAGRINANGSNITATPFNFGSTMTATSQAIKKDSNGKLIVAGYLINEVTNQASFLVGRLFANHSADPSFGSNGFVTTTFDHSISGSFDMKIQADGKIVLAGVSGNRIALARYNTGVASVEDHTENQIQLYPNPSTDYINILLNDKNTTSQITYHISDINGRTVMSGVLSEDNNRIDISELNNGIYFVSLEGNKNNFKFIKN
jgi:uncharacterized delta-60 repeat protein